MGSSRNKKNSVDENQRRRSKKTRMSDVHLNRKNDSSKKQQPEAQALVPKRSKFIESNSKHLPSKPRKVLDPLPSVSEISVKMSEIAPTFATKSTFSWLPPRIIPPNISHGIQIKNNERINFTPNFGGSSATFGKAPFTLNFQNSLRSEYASFNFANVYTGFTCPTFRSIAVGPGYYNFTLSKNNTLNPSSGTRSTATVTSTSSINGYKLNQITMSRNSTPSTGSSSTDSTTTMDGNVEGNSNDVTYLYTVDASPNGRIIEEIDLSESVTVDVTATSSSRNILRQESKVSKTKVENPGPSYSSNNSGLNQKCTESKNSRKRKISETGKEKPIKREKKDPFEPRCALCEVHYDDLTAVGEYMCIAYSCGHLFCHSCSRKDKKKCGECGEKIQLYRKLFL